MKMLPLVAFAALAAACASPAQNEYAPAASKSAAPAWDFKGTMGWAVLHFDPAVTKEQREVISTILGHLYPVKWDKFTAGPDAPMEWHATRDHAEAKLDGGKMAEVQLKKNQGMSDDAIVIKNLKYWGAPRNEGFVLMANEVEAYRAGDTTYEFKGTNGFMITLDLNANDVAAAGGMGEKKKGY